MKICIAGKNDLATKCTDFLLSNQIVTSDELLLCFNRSDNGVDSFQQSFKKYCLNLGLQETNLKNIYSIYDLIFISLEYDRIIDCNKFVTKSLFNIHFSLLPKYKGVYTSAWPILNGDTSTGVTLHCIDNGIDTGDIIDQIEFPIDYNDNCRDLYQKYTNYGIILFKNNIHNLVSKNYQQTKQPSKLSSYFSKSSINYSNITIDLNKTAFEIRNQIRAFNFKEYQIPEVYGHKIVASDILNSITRILPGSILLETEQYIDICTIDYDLRLYKA
ncbi:MAG: formyltransferase family protein [Cuspidothrix sp.]